MGNQASSAISNLTNRVQSAVTNVVRPTPAPTPAPPPPPVIPVCDSACQRQKEINNLKAALDSATLTKNSEPEKYQKARIAYYTAVNGQGWLQEERKRIADEKVSPAVLQITEFYKELKTQSNNQSALMNLIDVINSEHKQKEEEIKYITDQTSKNMDEATALNRLGFLTQEHFSMPEFNLELWLQTAIAILTVMVLYSLYRRIRGSTSVPTDMPVGGKRVPSHLTR